MADLREVREALQRLRQGLHARVAHLLAAFEAQRDHRELHEALQRPRQGLHARVAHLAVVEAQLDPRERERERENRIFPFSSLRSPVYPRQLMAAGKYNICNDWKKQKRHYDM